MLILLNCKFFYRTQSSLHLTCVLVDTQIFMLDQNKNQNEKLFILEAQRWVLFLPRRPSTYEWENPESK